MSTITDRRYDLDKSLTYRALQDARAYVTDFDRSGAKAEALYERLAKAKLLMQAWSTDGNATQAKKANEYLDEITSILSHKIGPASRREFADQGGKRFHSAKRARASAKDPSATKDTKLDIVSGSTTFSFTLRPAKVKIDYTRAGGELRAFPAAKSDGAWFVISKSGKYLGVVEEGAESPGLGSWGCLRFTDGPVGAVPASGVVLSANLRVGETWKDAIANSWWV